MKPQTVLKKMLPIVCMAAALLILLTNPDITAETIMNAAPENPILAACLIILLYAFKSATVVFPLMVLEIAAGLLFPTGTAIFINFLGVLTLLTVPYWIGIFSGIETVEKTIQKYPKFGAILDRQQENSFFLCFLFRIVSCLPCDVVSMYLGAIGTPFRLYLSASTLGLLPGMILATLLGAGIKDPTSPMFWITVIIKTILAVASVILYSEYRRKKAANRSGGAQ